VGLQAVGALFLYTVAIELAFVAGGFALGVVEDWALPKTAVSEDIGILLSAALTVAVFAALSCSYAPILIAIHQRGCNGCLGRDSVDLRGPRGQPGSELTGASRNETTSASWKVGQ
jgi:hypothetical protein